MVRAHGPSGVLLVGSDGNQTGIGRELALSALLLQSVGFRNRASFVVTGVVVSMMGGFDACNERDKRSSAGGGNVKLHSECGVKKSE